MRAMQLRWLLLLGVVTGCGEVANNPDAAIAPTMRTVTIAVNGNGTGSVTSLPAGINCGTKCSAEFAEGSSITLSAQPTNGSEFLGWAGGSCAGTSDCTIVVSADVTVQPIFALTNSIVVTTTGNGVGTVTSAPTGIICPGDCSEAYGPGVTVTLSAAPGAESVFAGWSGGGCTGTELCIVTTNNATSVIATFTRKRYTVTVDPGGNGAGIVTSTPAGISCGSTCMHDFDSGTMISLAAAPSTGSTFSGWAGACTGNAACNVTVTAAKNVIANFTLTKHTLAVTKTGNGTGTVTSNPSGIDCGTTACSADFNYNTNVILTPSTNGNNAFAGWSGACSGMGTCAVSMTTARSVTASFIKTIGCSFDLDLTGCGSGAIADIVLTGLTAQQCHDQCVLKMPQADMTTGCWMWISSSSTCYCKNGAATHSQFGGGTGGSCQ